MLNQGTTTAQQCCTTRWQRVCSLFSTRGTSLSLRREPSKSSSSPTTHPPSQPPTPPINSEPEGNLIAGTHWGRLGSVRVRRGRCTNSWENTSSSSPCSSKLSQMLLKTHSGENPDVQAGGRKCRQTRAKTQSHLRTHQWVSWAKEHFSLIIIQHCSQNFLYLCLCVFIVFVINICHVGRYRPLFGNISFERSGETLFGKNLFEHALLLNGSYSIHSHFHEKIKLVKIY